MSSEHRDLADCIDRKGVQCYNEDSEYPLSGILLEESGREARSDADEQLLIVVPFHSPVRIHSINLAAGVDEDAAPVTVKLYVNRPSMDFSDTESTAATQVLKLSDADLAADQSTLLRFVRFQNVHSITVRAP